MGDEYDSSVDVSDVDTSSDSSADYSVDTPSDDYSDSIDDFSEDISSDDYGEIADDIPDEITEDTYDDSTTDVAEDTLDVPEDIEEDISSENFEETKEDISEDILEDTEKAIVEDNQENTDDSFDDIPEDTESNETEVETSSDIPEEIEEDVEPEVIDELAEEAEVVNETDEVEPTDELAEEEAEVVDETAEVETTEELAEEDAEVVDETTEAETTDELAEEETEVVDETTEAETTDELAEEEAEVVDETTEAETTDELAEEEAEVVDETAEVETTEELAEEDPEVVDETAEVETTDELAEEEAEVVDETAEAETTDELTEEEVEVVDENDDENEIPPPEALGYHEGEIPLLDENASDLEKASSALDYALSQKEAYLKRVSNGEFAEDKDTLSAFDDAISYAQEKYDEVSNGQPYDEEKASNFFRTQEGQNVVGLGAKAFSKAVQFTGGYSDPTGTVDNAVSDFAKVATPYVIDKSELLMQNAYDAYEPSEIKTFHKEFFMKDANGNPITVEQGRESAFAKTHPSSETKSHFEEGTEECVRSIPGTPGVVNVKVNSEGKTVGNSSELSKNLWKSFEDVPLASYESADDLPQKAKGYQAQHIIPVEMHSHPVLQKIGMDMNDASNGIFLPEPDGDVHALTTHKGYHAVYNKVCEEYLDKIYEKHGDDASVEAVEADVAKLQRGLKSVLEDGVPIYRRKANADQLDVSDRGGGATEDLLRKAIDKKFKI